MKRLFLSIFLLAVIGLPAAAFAVDLAVTFQAEETQLFVNDEGTWTVRITNPSATSDVTGATFTVTLPTGYVVTDLGGGTESAGLPHTLTWSALTINHDSYIERTFKAKPDCDASSGGQMQAQVDYTDPDPPGLPKTITATSSAITILNLEVSFFSGSTSLSVGEAGSWTARLTNSTSRNAPSQTLVATLPANYTVTNTGGGTEAPAGTITWSNISVSAGNHVDETFSARPDCTASPGLTMHAYGDCPSNSVDSTPIAVKIPSLSIKKTSGGVAQPQVHLGDTVIWDIEFKNGGAGDILNGVAATDTLGGGFTYVPPINPNDGWPSWNTGLISGNTSKIYHLTTTVSSCANLTNEVVDSWGDGTNICQSFTTSVGAELIKRLPNVSITVTPPSPVTYCGWNTPAGNTATIKIDNSIGSDGPANAFFLEVLGLPADYGVKNIIVTTGGAGSVTWNNATKRFDIGNITGGTNLTRPVVEFTFQTGPTGAPCNVASYYWGTAPVTLTFQPVYNDECGFAGAPPTEGPYDFTVNPGSVPYFRASKSGPDSASIGDTGLTYNISTAYYAPAGSANVIVDIVDTYPAPFTVTNAGGGTVNLGNHTITWSNVTLVPNVPWTNTIVMSAPTNHCDADKDYTDSLVIYPQVGFAVDCLGCTVFSYPFGSWQNTYINDPSGPIASSSKTVTYYNSMTTDYTHSLGWGEVCTDNRYTTCYTFTGTAPPTWSDTDSFGHNISFGDRCIVGQTFVSVDAVRVNGTGYGGWPGTSVCDANPNNNNLDLAYLDGAAAPKPNTGATLCVDYTLHSVEASEIWGMVDFSGLTIPGYPTGCGGDEDYDQGARLRITKSYVAVNTSASPKVIDACEAKQFTIEIADHFNDWPDLWPLYDAQITLDTKGNYTLLGGVGDPTYPITFTNINQIDGVAIPAFNPVQAGDVHTWDFGDIRHHQANGAGYSPSPRITFWMRKNCDATQKDWSADIYFNNRCNDNADPRTSNTSPGVNGHHYPNEGVTLVKKGNPMANIVPPTVSATSRYPQFSIQGWNAGTGGLYNLNVQIDNNNQLLYYSSTTSGTPPTSSPPNALGGSEDPASPFVWDNLVPNAKGNIVITNKLANCANPHTDIEICWGCGAGCSATCTSGNCSSTPCCGDADICLCQTAGIDYLLPSPAVMVIEHSADKIDYCGNNSQFTIKSKNTSAINAYNVKIVENLPPGLDLTVIPTSFNYTCDGGLTGTPAATITGDPIAGFSITWDFSNVLPTDAYGDRPMKEGCEITIQFNANITSCLIAQAYSGGNKRASAHVEFDPPCNLPGGSIIHSSDYNLYTEVAHPRVTIVKEGRNVTKGTAWTQGTVIADTSDTIEWRVTLNSNGDYLAHNVRLQDAIPANTNYVAGSTTLDGAAQLDTVWAPGTAPNGIAPGSNTFSLGDMNTGTSHVVIFRTTVTGCVADTTNRAQITWGCLTGCTTTPPTEQQAEDSVSLRTIPYLAMTTSDISPLGYFVTDGGKLRVVITNYGARATIGAGDYLNVPLPTGFNYDASCGPTITSNIPAHGGLVATPSTTNNNTCSGANGELQWDNTRIDYIDTGETITLEFNLEADGCYLDTTCAGHGPDANAPNTGTEHIPIPNTSIQTSLSYHNSCLAASTLNANLLTINPRQPDLDISVDPTAPVINPGDTTKLFTFTIRNSGDATASHIAMVGGGINEPFVSTIGTGFSTPTVMGNTCGGNVTTGASSITIDTMSNLNAGATCTVQIRVNIIPNQSADKYWIDGEIRGTSLRCDGAVVDAASQPCASHSYSDDKVKAAAGEGKLVLRPDHTGEGKPCGEVIYLHTIRNNGSVADWFDLTAVSSKNWKYVFYQVDSNGNITGTPITGIYLCNRCPVATPDCTCTIPPAYGGGTAHDHASFAVRLFIPCDAAWNTVDNTVITACYRSDPQTCRSVTDTTTVITKLFMKKEARNVTAGGTFSDSATGKPTDVVEYRITFQNYTTTDLSGITISDPIPPFSTLNTTAGGPYPSGGVNYPVKVEFTFDTPPGPCTCYTTPTSPIVTVAIPTGCANPGCAPAPCTCNCGQVTTLKPGEKGEVYYQVTINN